ncbi:MAG: hypothetical protein VCC04_02690, partial [Myxococcota bacterium]
MFCIVKRLQLFRVTGVGFLAGLGQSLGAGFGRRFRSGIWRARPLLGRFGDLRLARGETLRREFLHGARLALLGGGYYVVEFDRPGRQDVLLGFTGGLAGFRRVG